MKVLTVHEDQAILDLVVHFLGIAIHDNINAAPSAKVLLTSTSEAEDSLEYFIRDQI